MTKRERVVDLPAYAQACYAGSVRDIEAWLDGGADVNESSVAFDKEERTPLMLACTGNRGLDVVCMLYERGAKVRMADRRGNTAIHFALKNTNYAVVEWLVDTGGALLLPGAEPIAVCAVQNKTDDALRILQFVLTRDIDVNAIGPAGRSALHYTARNDPNGERVSMLLAHGADHSVVDKAGDTALHLACDNANAGAHVVPLLLAAGANPTTRDSDGDPCVVRTLGNSTAMLRMFIGIGGLSVALYNDVPDESSSDDYMERLSLSITHFGGRAPNTDDGHGSAWAAMRVGSVGKYRGLFETLEKHVDDPRMWYWVGSEMQSRLEGPHNETILHVACRTSKPERALAPLLRLGTINPHLRRRNGQRPIDMVAPKTEAHRMLSAYMQWRPTRQHTLWLGPFFERTVHEFLLVCNRLRVLHVRDVRHYIIALVAAQETVCLNVLL